MRLALVALVGCAAPPQLMRPAAPSARPDPYRAVVVFVHHHESRPASCAPGGPCMSAPAGWHANGSPAVRIVDESGDLLGDSAADTSFAAVLAPGDHAFVGWTRPWDDDGVTFALRASLAAGRVYYIDVRARAYYGQSHGKSPAPWMHELELHAIHRDDQVDPAQLVARTAWREADDELAVSMLAGDFARIARAQAAAASAPYVLGPDDGY